MLFMKKIQAQYIKAEQNIDPSLMALIDDLFDDFCDEGKHAEVVHAIVYEMIHPSRSFSPEQKKALSAFIKSSGGEVKAMDKLSIIVSDVIKNAKA